MIMTRVRAYAAQLGLLAALVALAAFLSTGPGRLANGTTDEGLRSDIGALLSSSRDLTFSLDGNRLPGVDLLRDDRSVRLDQIRDGLPGPLPGLIEDSWFVAEAGPVDAAVAGVFLKSCPTRVGVRRQTGSDQATRMVEGRRPKSENVSSSSKMIIEAIVGTVEAKALGLRVGDTVTLIGRSGKATVRVVGRYEPVDAAAPFWDDMRLAREACDRADEDTRYRATLLTDMVGVDLAGALTGEYEERWRYRLDAAKLTADQVPAMTLAIGEIRRHPPEQTAVRSAVDTTLAEFEKRLRAVQAVLAVVRTGILATVAGLILLAARLAADRRRAEYALIRARGGAVRRIAGRVIAETAVVVLPAALLGWLAGLLVPGRPAVEEPALVAGFALFGLLAPAVIAAAAARRPDFTGHRGDLVAGTTSPRRITAELFVIGLAAGGAYLLRSRGIGSGASSRSGTSGAGGGVGVDPYLIAVPVLLAVAASLIALRLVPFPLRVASRIAARGRGALAFLGLAGAGRSGGGSTALRSWPLSVLVVAIATGIFTGTVASTVGNGRDRATDVAVPADAMVTGFSFAVETPERIAALDGVTAAVPMLLASAAEVRSDASPLISQVQAMVVDASVPQFRVPGRELPAALTEASKTEASKTESSKTEASKTDVVPALASPRLAQRIGSSGQVDIQGRRYAFRVAAVRDTAPGLGTSVREFLVLPSQAMPIPDFQPLVPNRILIDGSGWDPDAVRTVADEGQRAQTRKATGADVDPSAVGGTGLAYPATVTTHAGYRASLDEQGVDGVLSFTFTAGVVAAAALALLAVALIVLAGAPARGQTLSRLRTLGLSTGQGRGLLVFELVPLLGVAILAGAAIGAALPALIAPALGLDDFTAGVPAEISTDPFLVAGVLAVTVLAVTAALVVEDAANRRLRLGTVLRLGEDQP